MLLYHNLPPLSTTDDLQRLSAANGFTEIECSVLKPRVIAAKTKGLPVMSDADFFVIVSLTFHREECQVFCSKIRKRRI